MSLLSSIFSAIANAFGWATGRSALRNSTSMQASAAAKTDAAIKSESSEAVAAAKTGDAEAVEKLRRLTAE